jgi:hypothetical protein
MRIFYLLLLTLFCACSADKPVRIELEGDSSFLPGFIEDITYQCNGEIIDPPEVIRNEQTGENKMIWDSSAAGNYTVELSSIFLLQTAQSFVVNSDTTLFVQNNFPVRIVDTITKADFMKADTIEYVRVSIGCFHHRINKTVLLKNEFGYEVRYYGESYPYASPQQISKEDGRALMAELYSFQEEIISDCKQGRFSQSTSYTNVYLRADNNIFCRRRLTADWAGFNSLYLP